MKTPEPFRGKRLFAPRILELLARTPMTRKQLELRLGSNPEACLRRMLRAGQLEIDQAASEDQHWHARVYRLPSTRESAAR